MALIKYPYTNLHELNLDWLIEQLNNPDGPVRSVNGKSGIVALTGEDIARSTSNPETVAAALQTQGSAIQTVRNQIGVTALPTVAQTLTGAIAENAQEIADIEDNVIGSTALPTTAQTLTGAIAENAGNISGNASSITGINNKIGTTALPTTAQTLTGAVAEVDSDITSITNKIGNTALPTTAQTLTGAIAENANDITDISAQLDFSSRNVSVPYTVPANGQYNTNLKTIIDADLPSGYTVLGIVGFTTNEVNVYFVGCSYSDTAYSFQIKNISSDQRTGSARVWYLVKHN